MNATIKKIDPPKRSFSGQMLFRRVYFELEDGRWAVTDVVPTFRNYRFWKPILTIGVGVKIGGVQLKSSDKVDADSRVYVSQAPLIPKVEEIKQSKLF